mmetsp:Transcript_21217/g.47885  ORF Transcript_21217/g.47885 Transcript_21217/m.47885 type:complete len:219 (-) Transcript_21217:51-707(-)
MNMHTLMATRGNSIFISLGGTSSARRRDPKVRNSCLAIEFTSRTKFVFFKMQCPQPSSSSTSKRWLFVSKARTVPDRPLSSGLALRPVSCTLPPTANAVRRLADRPKWGFDCLGLTALRLARALSQKSLSTWAFRSRSCRAFSSANIPESSAASASLIESSSTFRGHVVDRRRKKVPDKVSVLLFVFGAKPNVGSRKSTAAAKIIRGAILMSTRGAKR